MSYSLRTQSRTYHFLNRSVTCDSVIDTLVHAWNNANQLYSLLFDPMAFTLTWTTENEIGYCKPIKANLDLDLKQLLLAKRYVKFIK